VRPFHWVETFWQSSSWGVVGNSLYRKRHCGRAVGSSLDEANWRRL
jgi:hypothetical protein